MKKSIRHACSLTQDTNRAASVTDHYLWINLERFTVKIWIIWPLDLFKDVLQRLANSEQKVIQSSFTLYTGQIDPQTWRVHVNQCGSFRCMRESTRGSYEAPESCRTRSDAQPLISSTLNIPSPLIWKRRTEMRRAANTATRLQWAGPTDRSPTDRQVLWETHASHCFHSNEGRDIKDAVILTLNSYTSKRVSVVTVRWTDSHAGWSFYFMASERHWAVWKASFLSVKRSKRNTDEKRRRKTPASLQHFIRAAVRLQPSVCMVKVRFRCDVSARKTI